MSTVNIDLVSFWKIEPWARHKSPAFQQLCCSMIWMGLLEGAENSSRAWNPSLWTHLTHFCAQNCCGTSIQGAGGRQSWLPNAKTSAQSNIFQSPGLSLWRVRKTRPSIETNRYRHIRCILVLKPGAATQSWKMEALEPDSVMNPSVSSQTFGKSKIWRFGKWF